MNTHLHRRGFMGALSAAGLAACGLAHAQPSWPSRPVRIVVGFSPGGTTDLLARVVGQALSQNLGQPFTIDNKAGASGAIAAVDVAGAAPDGHTLLLGTTTTHSIAPHVTPNLRYKPVEDFTPIALLAEVNNVIIATPTLEARNMAELIALARQKPGFLNYTSSGIGSITHLWFESLQARTGVTMTHVPYKGSGSAFTDLISGAVQVTLDALPSGLPHVKGGRLKLLAVTGPQRSPLAPDAPTVAETVPGFAVNSWFGLYAPKGMSPELTRRINAEASKALQSAEMKARFTEMGIEAGQGSPADFAAMVAKDSDGWARVARQVNLKP